MTSIDIGMAALRNAASRLHDLHDRIVLWHKRNLPEPFVTGVGPRCPPPPPIASAFGGAIGGGGVSSVSSVWLRGAANGTFSCRSHAISRIRSA